MGRLQLKDNLDKSKLKKPSQQRRHASTNIPLIQHHLNSKQAWKPNPKDDLPDPKEQNGLLSWIINNNIILPNITSITILTIIINQTYYITTTITKSIDNDKSKVKKRITLTLTINIKTIKNHNYDKKRH